MPTNGRLWGILALVFAGALLAVFLVRREHPRPYRADGPTIQALRAFANQQPQGAIVRLAELTPFAWDSAYFFAEATERKDISAALGVNLFAGKTGRNDDRGPLLVFKHSGTIVESVLIVPPLFISSPGRSVLPPSVLVKAHSQGLPRVLLLGLPDSNDPSWTNSATDISGEARK